MTRRRPEGRAVIVELAGPAGAGKTTLARRLGAGDRRIRVDLSLWGPAWADAAVSAVGVLPTIVAAAVAAWVQGSRPLRWAEIAQMIRVGALRRCVERASQTHRIIILDEGPVFALSWLDVFFVRTGHPGFAGWRRRTLADWAALLDVVILLDASDPELAHRIRTRAKPHPVKGEPDAKIYGFAAGFRRAFERVIADLVAAGDVTVAALPTDADSQRSADRLLATLEEPAHGS